MGNTIRWTPEQLEAHNTRLIREASALLEKANVGSQTGLPDLMKKDKAIKRFQALGRLPKNRMNKTESAYADVLEQRRRCGQILDYQFHPANVRLADSTFYEIDFIVLVADMTVEIHEVKGGYTTEKGNMKIKLCAEALPWFRFLKVSRLPKQGGGGWQIEEY